MDIETKTMEGQPMISIIGLGDQAVREAADRINSSIDEIGYVFPRRSTLIKASAPHPEGTEYKVSIGDEDWEGLFQTVVKVQMVSNGKVQGRKSPSYPIGTDDFKRVAEAIDMLMEITKKK